MTIKLGTSIILLIFLTSCFSISSYQTADTVPKGDIELGLALSIVKTETDIAGGEGEDEVIGQKTSNFPVFEFISRYGLLNGLDFGLKLTSSGLFDFDFKFRVLSFGDDTDRFAIAIKPMVSIPIVMGDSDNILPFIVYSGRVSLLMSKRFTKVYGMYFALNYSPKLTNGTYEFSDAKESTFSAVLGVSVEEESFWFRPEILVSGYNSKPAITFGVGAGIKF